MSDHPVYNPDPKDGLRSNSGWWWFIALGGVLAAFLGTSFYAGSTQKADIVKATKIAQQAE